MRFRPRIPQWTTCLYWEFLKSPIEKIDDVVVRILSSLCDTEKSTILNPDRRAYHHFSQKILREEIPRLPNHLRVFPLSVVGIQSGPKIEIYIHAQHADIVAY